LADFISASLGIPPWRFSDAGRAAGSKHNHCPAIRKLFDLGQNDQCEQQTTQRVWILRDGAPVALPVIIGAADDADDAPPSRPQIPLDVGID